VGELWSVVSIRSDEKGGEITARSNEFTVTEPQPLLQPILSIWPLGGPPGTGLSVVGSNYPSMSKIHYVFGVEDDEPFITSTTWTEINGTFAIDLFIPTSADAGEIWVVSAQDIDNPQINATSPSFLVSGP
jgi:hypothetical protein